MPVFRSGVGLAPAWCEMEYFEIVKLSPGERHTFERIGCKEKLIVGCGQCTISFAGRTVDAQKGANLDLDAPEDAFRVLEVFSEATLIRMCGHWGDETGGSGVFTLAEGDGRRDRGDPVDYIKRTGLDRHYHDCDEYWILFEGRGIAVSENRSYEIGPGDCVATGMGHHHDLPRVFEPIEAVYFETTLEGEERRGHLWEHTHGPARPQANRV